MNNPDTWFDRGLEHIWIPYAQMKTIPMPVPIVATSGTRLKLADGRELVDGVGSWWTSVHGYNHPVLIKAAHDQLDQMPHIMLGGLAHKQAYKLAARLADVTPGDLSRVFFSESGSVGVEVAMKIAVQYARNALGETRTKFVSFMGGYHGDTFATMSVCDPEEGMHTLFAEALAPQHIVELPDSDARLEQIDTLLTQHKDIAAILVEPLIQGASGMRMHTAETLAHLRTLADRHGVLLIFDEIFTGFGRTGELFAAHKAAVTPDIMTLGKGLTGGVTPLAATIASKRVYQAFHDEDPSHALMHGPTFTGHAVGCAVANAGLDLFETEPRLDQARALERAMEEALRPLESHTAVREVRICGAVAAVELKEAFDIDASRQWFIDQGTFIRPLGRAVYLTPAYTISPGDLQTLTCAITDFVDSA